MNAQSGIWSGIAVIAGLVWASNGGGIAETVVSEGRLDIPDSAISTLRAEGRSCVTVHEGGTVDTARLDGQSFGAIQTGSTVDSLRVSGEATAQVCGGEVEDIYVESGGTLRATSGLVTHLNIQNGGKAHIYGSNLVRSQTKITGTWPNGSPFQIPISGAGANTGIILHDTALTALPDSGLRAHYRLDESQSLRAYDGTTFIHHAAGGDYITTIPPGANIPGGAGNASVTTGAPAIASGTSAQLAGGASATIEGHHLPDFDGGATVSFWFQQELTAPWVISLMSKAQPGTGGHPRSLALCYLPSRQFLLLNDFGVNIRGPVIDVGQSYHTAITFTPDGPLTKLELFVDGVSYGSQSGRAEDLSIYDLNIGGWSNAEAGITGRMDDVQIYDRPLATTEIHQLHDNPGVTLTDIDRDSMLDDQEYAYFGTLQQGPEDDYDGDGIANATEMTTTKTAPDDYSSNFAIESVERSGGVCQVTFSSVPGLRYQLESSTDGGANWLSRGGIYTAHGASLSIPDSSAASGALYRVTIR